MGKWLETLKMKQERAVALRTELARIEAELRDARAILRGEPIQLDRPRSRHGFTNGKRAKPIQEGSSVWWTAKVLQMAGRPLHIDQILARVHEESGLTFQKATVVSNLSRYVKYLDTFTRPAPSTYGLVEFDRGELEWPADSGPLPPQEGDDAA